LVVVLVRPMVLPQEIMVVQVVEVKTEPQLVQELQDKEMLVE
jgi:hypothetical protein